jgi:hypothetical protein
VEPVELLDALEHDDEAAERAGDQLGQVESAATGTPAASTIWATLIPQYQMRAVVACRTYHWIWRFTRRRTARRRPWHPSRSREATDFSRPARHRPVAAAAGVIRGNRREHDGAERGCREHGARTNGGEGRSVAGPDAVSGARRLVVGLSWAAAAWGLAYAAYRGYYALGGTGFLPARRCRAGRSAGSTLPPP